MSNIQALVDALKWYQEIAQSANRHIDSANKATVLHALLVELSLDAGNRATQALADYKKSHLEPEASNSDEATVATLRSSSPNSIEHELKTWSEYFEEVLNSRKNFEIRKNDRGFKVGDTLLLKEVEFGGAGMTDHDLTQFPTGRQISVGVKYILHGGKFGLLKDFVIMAIEKINHGDIAGSQTNSIDKK